MGKSSNKNRNRATRKQESSKGTAGEQQESNMGAAWEQHEPSRGGSGESNKATPGKGAAREQQGINRGAAGAATTVQQHGRSNQREPKHPGTCWAPARCGSSTPLSK